MTVTRDIFDNRDMMHMHGWSDGGGTYGAVVELMPNDEARVTLLSDTVETFTARKISPIPLGALNEIWTEHQSAEDFAGTYASELESAGFTIDGVTRDDYVIVSHGLMFAVRMFGAPEDN